MKDQKKTNRGRERLSKELVFSELCRLKLFGSEEDYVIYKIANANGRPFASIKPYFTELYQEGRILCNEDGRIENATKTYTGTVVKAQESYAYVEVDGRDKDIYVYDRDTATIGDTVEIAVRDMFGKQEGVILNIKQKGQEVLFGDVVKNSSGEIVFKPSDISFDQEVILVGDNDCYVGRKVKVQLTFADVRFSKNKKNAIIGKVVEQFGLSGDPIVENVVIANSHDFYKEFPTEVLTEISSIPDEVIEADRLECKDLTHLNFCTIDPENCKDIDDAIYVERNSKGFVAYVALADVAHYVKEGSLLDKEAYFRGTSCYLADGVYPMLPEKLSNGICSLNPHVDRRTICAKINVDNSGNITNYEFIPAIINSKHKLSYEKAHQIHEDEQCADKYTNVKQSIDMAYKLSDILVKAKNSRGAINVNTDEPTYILDKSKTGVKDIVNKKNIPSTKIIESLMILFNEAVGDLAENSNSPMLYRIHEKPRRDKINFLQHMCAELGIYYDGDSSSNGINNLLKEIKGNEKEDFIHALVLRSLQKAKYSPKNLGHYALASKNYIHSTAAIRRYPDIITQRFIKSKIQGKKFETAYEDLELYGKFLTGREISADKASEESRRLMNVIWAEGQKNKKFTGFISGLHSQGVFVKLKEQMVEVFIPFENLVRGNLKHYKVNNLKTEITCKKWDETYRIGDNVTFTIVETDRNTRRILAESVNIKKKVMTDENNNCSRTHDYNQPNQYDMNVSSNSPKQKSREK